VTYKEFKLNDDINILGENIYTIKEITEAQLEDIKEVGLEVNTEKTKYMFVFYHQNVGQNDFSNC
jgi:hypothetical protein